MRTNYVVFYHRQIRSRSHIVLEIREMHNFLNCLLQHLLTFRAVYAFELKHFSECKSAGDSKVSKEISLVQLSSYY